MPFTLALAATLASLAASGISIGETFANRPSAPKMPTMPTGPTQGQQAAQQQMQRAAVTQQLPNIQASTSGFTNPGYNAMMAQLQSGTAGQPGAGSSANQAVMQAFGMGAPVTPKNLNLAGSTTNTAIPPSQTTLSDFANQFFRG